VYPVTINKYIILVLLYVVYSSRLLPTALRNVRLQEICRRLGLRTRPH